MEGWVVKVEGNKSKYGYVLAGLTIYNPKLKKVLNAPNSAPLIFIAQITYEPTIGKDAEDGKFFVFEDKGEAEEFLGLLKRFQALDEILYWETYKTSEGFRHLKLSLQKVSAKKIVYADFDQVTESFDGFEEKMEKAAKKLA